MVKFSKVNKSPVMFSKISRENFPFTITILFKITISING